jgi:lipid-A-disaccharide synthase
MAEEHNKLVWIIAGEASGDAYGAALANALHKREPQLRLRGMGMEKMRAAGVDIFVDSSELGIIGIWEAVKHLAFFVKLMKRMVTLAAEERPDTVVMIDYPGFNLRFAQRLHALGIRVVWYVSPQVWAWKKGRIWKLAKYCDRMLCIFPFEPECYAPTSLRAQFVGHPLLSMLEPVRQKGIARDENLVLMLPGSRRMELERLMPVFLQAACILHRRNPQLKFEFALPRPAILELAQGITAKCALGADTPQFTWSVGVTREHMCAAGAALAASGTVTVEAALLGLPVVVAYRLNWLSWLIAKSLVHLSSITIANLVCGKTVFEEYLQDACTAEHLASGIEKIIPGGARRTECLALLDDFRQRLGSVGDVSENVATIVLEGLK